MKNALIEKIKKLRGEGAPALYYDQQMRVGICKRGGEPVLETDGETEENGTWRKFRLTIPLFDIAVVATVWCLLRALFGKKKG